MASIGMLLNTDRCTGCYSCQTACREANRFGYDEKWMEVVRRDPRPLCTKVCTTGALQVGPVEGLLKLRAKSNVVLYAPKGE